MRPFFYTSALSLAPFLSFPNVACAVLTATPQPVRQPGVTVLEYRETSAYTKFLLPFDSAGAADESLVFEVQINPTTDLSTSDVVVNDQKLDITWHANRTHSSQLVSVVDTAASSHEVNLTWVGSVSAPPSSSYVEESDVTQNIGFNFEVIDLPSRARSGFFVVSSPTAERRLRGLISTSTVSVSFERFSAPMGAGTDSHHAEEEMGEFHSNTGIDLAAELESLRLLEADAEVLRSRIAEKKQSIFDNLRQHREKVTLKHLIKECDGIMCAARAVVQRVCDKLGVSTDAFEYAQVNDRHIQHMLASTGDAKEPHSHSRNCTTPKHAHLFPNKISASSHSAHLSLMMTKNESSSPLRSIDLLNPPNPLVRALQIIAAALGLSAIIAFIRQKCMSVRTRRERAADREERRNARAYRRAARRALIRKRWDNFVYAINCFRQPPEPRMEDYEEKRALILQDAFLEQDLDQAEKGEIMEAEIRELRYAHEIVSSLVRVDEHRYDLITPIHDPPPPMVPLPYTPASRSRASTGTLPSYTSESLPDYTSTPRDDSSSVGGDEHTHYTPSTSDEGLEGLISPISEGSEHRRYTPTSSVLESPRISEDTLRTRQSRDTRDI